MNQIGPYPILEELGRGGMGVVYLSRDPRTGREVAVKALLSGREATPLQRRRFEREARALAKVNHPNVVRLLDVGEDKSTLYLVMDYHPGGSLEDRLKGPPLPLAYVIRIGCQLASGLAAAHAQGLLHRDIKPANILLGPAGLAMLTDFGLAKDLDRSGHTQALTREGAFLGTPGFWAPEQAEGRLSECGPATDVYGLGAVLYSALSGRAPIIGDSFAAILAATSEERPPPIRSLRSEVPRELESVVMRCLEKKPSDRWGSAAELEQALEACFLAPASSGRVTSLVVAGTLVLATGVAVAATQWPRVGGPGSTPTLASPSGAGGPLKADASASPLGETSPPSQAPTQASPDKEAAELRRAAEQGDVDAMVALGKTIAMGRRDDAEAVRWFRLAAEEGHLEGMTRLGDMLSNGRGASKDDTQAAQLYRRAAEGGHPAAMFGLGLMLQMGRGSAQDPAQAARWYRRAAEQGNLDAMVNLGFMLASGRDVPQDVEAAMGWYRRAAEQGSPAAMNNLGWALYRAGGSKRVEAVVWFRRAAEKGQLNSMFYLARALEKGQGVAQDELAAAAWYLRGAKAGDANAMCNLALMLASGRGGPKDKVEAVRWLRRAAQSDNPTAKRIALATLEKLEE